MLISKTPYRVSFFGGGTDYEGWYKHNSGSFISMSIDKFCYIYARHLPPFFEYQSRIVWSKIEQVNDVEQIIHPVIREGLKLERIKDIELHHIGDLPARSGLGSSSSFSVGLLNVLRAMKGQETNKSKLAIDAIKLERDILSESGGIQDQIAAAFGGFNYVEIEKNGEFNVQTIELKQETKLEFESSLLLVFTGLFRNSFEIAAEQTSKLSKNFIQLEMLSNITNKANSILKQASFVKDFGELLNETWQVKKEINKKISNTVIDEIYDTAMQSGAFGGKLLGAGAGGFMIFVIPENNMSNVRASLDKFIQVPVKIDYSGSQVYENKSIFRGE